MATVSDRRIQVDTDSDGTVDNYNADIVSANDYYPFGMIMPQASPDSLLFSSSFETGTDGWVIYNAGTLQNDNGRLKFLGTVPWSTPKKDLQLKTGKQYRVRFTIDMGNCKELHLPIYKADITSFETLSEVGLSITASGTYEGTFTATSNSMMMLFEMIPGVNPPPDSTGYYWLDNISIEEVKPVDTTHVGKGGFRYGFNGKELDRETSNTTTYDYGFRIYSPALGHFLSVDPLTKKYPMLSTYQFAGNNPIRYVDLDGLEPANNPKSPAAKEKVAMVAVDLMAAGAAKHDVEENLFSSGTYRPSDADLKGTYFCGATGTYVTDTKGDPSNKFNMKVFNGATLNVDESQANHFNNYEAFVVDRLMTNFTTGEGAENYNFPTNGIISSKFLTSDILKDAIAKFNTGEVKPGEAYQSQFGGKELGKDLLRTGTLFSITGLTGSGTILINPNKDGVQIQIFNITSLTSGDLLKNPNSDTNWPKSYVRDPDKTTPYGNISQTYNLFIPWSSPLLLK